MVSSQLEAPGAEEGTRMQKDPGRLDGVVLKGPFAQSKKERTDGTRQEE